MCQKMNFLSLSFFFIQILFKNISLFWLHLFSLIGISHFLLSPLTYKYITIPFCNIFLFLICLIFFLFCLSLFSFINFSMHKVSCFLFILTPMLPKSIILALLLCSLFLCHSPLSIHLFLIFSSFPVHKFLIFSSFFFFFLSHLLSSP